MRSVSILAALLLFAAPVHSENLTEINLGVISSESQEAMSEYWQPLVTLMETRLGIPVKPYFTPDYAGVIQAMRFGKVQVAHMGAKAAVEAIDRSNGEVFATSVPLDGEPGYYSVIITRKDGPINSLEELLENGSRYTYGSGDPNSTSGYLVPGYYVFAKNSIDPKTHFKRTVFASHTNNHLAVLNGHIDAAANNTWNLDKMAQLDPARVEAIRILWQSRLIPDSPMVWRRDLADYDKDRIRAFFLGLGAPGPNQDEDVAALTHRGWARFEAVGNDVLLPVRELILFKKKMSTLQSESLSDEEKRIKVAEIDELLAQIKQTKN